MGGPLYELIFGLKWTIFLIKIEAILFCFFPDFSSDSGFGRCSIFGVLFCVAYHSLIISLCLPYVLLEVQEWRTRCEVQHGWCVCVALCGIPCPYDFRVSSSCVVKVQDWRTRCGVQHCWCVAWCGIPFPYDFLMSSLCFARGEGMENKM